MIYEPRAEGLTYNFSIPTYLIPQHFMGAMLICTKAKVPNLGGIEYFFGAMEQHENFNELN